MIGNLARTDDYLDPMAGPELPDVGPPLIGSGGQFSPGIPAVNEHVQFMLDKDRETLGKIGRGVMGALADTATLPQRAIQNSNFAVNSGVYDPAVPVEAALTTMGGGAAGAAAKRGEVVLGSGPVVKTPEMGFGATPQGTYKSWLLRYNPASGEPALVNTSGNTGNAFSSLKTGDSPAVMSRTLANEPAPYQYPPIDMAALQKQKAELIFGPTDRMYGGGELTHVSGQKLERPVPQEGGPNFPHLNRNAAVPDIPPDAAPLYASVTKTAAKVPLERAQAAIERGNTPYYVPVIMTHGAGDSSKQMANTVHQLVRQAEPGADAITKINAAIAAKGGKAPDFANREAFEEWLRTGLPARTAFTKAMDTKEVLKATGVDVSHARFANTDPRLYHTPAGSAGIIMGRMRPELGSVTSDLHSNYPEVFFGQRGEIGGAPGNIPFSLLAPDMHRGLVPKTNQGVSAATTPAIQVMRGLPKDIPQTQLVTDEVVNNWGEWFRRHPQGWGVAAGAPVLGGLAAQNDYRD